jgi:phosphinothricin acetyltransferase
MHSSVASSTFVVRTAAVEDAAQIAAIYAPFVRDSHTSFETEPPDEVEMRRRIADTQRTHPWLVCDRDGEVLGYAYATPHRARAAYQWCVETTVYVKDGLRRSGVGRALYRALFQVLEQQGFQMAYAAIALPNPGSAAMHEALGFEALGVYKAAGYKHGAWRDVGWWQRAIRPLDPNPSPPIPFRSLCGSDD